MQWVNTQPDFENVCRELAKASVLAIDTEFERRTTYYPIFALLQIFDGEETYLIDVQNISVCDDFKLMMANPNIVKIMHAAKEDLEVFVSSWQVSLTNLFDTQLAWSFCSGDLSLGYAGLVNKLLDVEVNKEATQTDWLQRPLTQEQLSYAAKDVEYLIDMYHQLNDSLAGKAARQYFIEECNQLCQQAQKEPEPNIDYRSAKEVWKLDASQLSLFKKLYVWREMTAKAENRTRNHLARDQQLVQIAMAQPTNRQSLGRSCDLHPRAFRQYADKIIDIVEDWKNEPLAEEKPVANPRDVAGFNALVSEIEKIVKTKSAELNISSTIIASKRLIRQIAFAKLCEEAFPSTYCGWRQKLLDDEIEKLDY